jgi:hypothetical protein
MDENRASYSLLARDSFVTWTRGRERSLGMGGGRACRREKKKKKRPVEDEGDGGGGDGVATAAEMAFFLDIVHNLMTVTSRRYVAKRSRSGNWRS